MLFELFSLLWSNVHEKNRKKIKNLNCEKRKKEIWSGNMVDRYLSPKCGVNPLDGFRESGVYGRTTTADDGGPFHDSSSAVQ